MSLAFPISVEARRLDGVVDYIDFPLTPSEMEQTVRDFGDNPEIVHYDSLPFDLAGRFGFVPTTPIRQIDLVARALERTPGAEEVVDNLVECEAPVMPTTPLGLANLFLQSAKVPWVDYDMPIHTVACSDEESFGYHLANQMGIYDELESENISSYFDFDKFGSDNAGSRVLGTTGYLDTSRPMPSFDRYGWNEVAAICQ